MGDAINALKAKLQTMSQTERADFEKKYNFSISAINLMNPDTATKICKDYNIDLGNTSAWVDYNKAKSDWNVYHNLYTQANKAYLGFKDQRNSAYADYQKLSAQAIQRNGGEKLSSSADNAIRQKSGYTTNVIRNTNDAENVADALLDKCYMAVDAQRAGLINGMIMDFKG